MSTSKPEPTIDELLDQAFEAIGRGQRIVANVLAGQVLALDRGNADAEDLLAAPMDQGEIRRLTMLFADLVDSTALSTRIEPETYRAVVGRYKERVRQVVDRYEGHVASTKGDGLLVVFGHPRAHEDDARRALHAGLDIAREVAALSERVHQRFGFTIEVRVGIHRGVVYLDLEQDDVYGLAANLAARVSGLAPPGGVVVSAEVERLTRKHFELRHLAAQPVKGIAGPIDHYQVLGERTGGASISDRPVVGRERELAHLENSWEKAKAGTLKVAGLAFCGEAGIGKSRLAATAIELAEQSQAVVVELTGSPLHSDVGLHPVRRLLERRCGIDRATSPAECIALLDAEVAKRGLDPATFTPLLAPVLAISPQAGYQAADADGPKLYLRIARAVRAYLLACMSDGPALVVAEDMHWFDEDTTEVVQSLLNDDSEGSGRFLVVMTSREPESLPNSEHIAHFPLAPLTDQETDELIVALYPELGADARRRVGHRCDGLPLFIEEVVAKLKEQPSDVAESVNVPDSLYEALFARLRSHHAVRVIEGAAVVGNPVDRRLLAAVVQIGDSELDAAIMELRDGRVLEPMGQGTWRFRHELLRDIATELSPPTRRREMHGRVADALLSSTAEANTDWPLIASHYERAERYESAASAYRKAAGAARRRGALNEARSYLSHAIAQIERLPAGPGRDRHEISLRQRRGLLFYATEGALGRNAAADFERCLALRGTEEDMLSTMSALYGHYVVRADLRRVQQLLEAVEASVVKGRPEAWPTVTAGFGMLAWYRGEFDVARQRLETAVSLRHHVGQDVIAGWFMANEPIASIHTHLAMARYIQGDLSGAADELLASARRCDEVGSPQGPYSLAYTRQMEVFIRMESGELDRAATVTAGLTSDARKHGFGPFVAIGTAVQAVVAALLTMTNSPTDHEALCTHIEAVTGIVDAWRAIGYKAMLTFYDAVLARLLLAAGRPADARDRVDAGMRLAEETGMHFYDAELLRIRAHTHDDLRQRRDGLRAAIELARRQHAVIFELRAAADDFELHGEPARQQLQDSVLRLPDASTWPELSRARALLG